MTRFSVKVEFGVAKYLNAELAVLSMETQTMVTQQTAILGQANPCDMEAMWSTLVMYPTL